MLKEIQQLDARTLLLYNHDGTILHLQPSFIILSGQLGLWTQFPRTHHGRHEQQSPAPHTTGMLTDSGSINTLLLPITHKLFKRQIQSIWWSLQNKCSAVLALSIFQAFFCSTLFLFVLCFKSVHYLFFNSSSWNDFLSLIFVHLNVKIKPHIVGWSKVSSFMIHYT